MLSYCYTQSNTRSQIVICQLSFDFYFWLYQIYTIPVFLLYHNSLGFFYHNTILVAWYILHVFILFPINCFSFIHSHLHSFYPFPSIFPFLSLLIAILSYTSHLIPPNLSCEDYATCAVWGFMQPMGGGGGFVVQFWSQASFNRTVVSCCPCSFSGFFKPHMLSRIEPRVDIQSSW